MRFFAVCFCLLFTRFISAQSYTFTSYSIPEGLAQTQVKAIAEDQNGYLWVGTLGGLSRFNGSVFTNFSSEDGLLNNHITTLFSHGREVWIGHQGGISLYKGRTFKHWSFGDNTKDISVTQILYFNNKLVVATRKGLYMLDKNRMIALPLSSSDQNWVRGLESLNGKLYLATREGLFETSDLKRFTQVTSRFELNLTGICHFRGHLYLSDTDGKIYAYYPGSNSMREEVNIRQEVFLNSCFIDSKGNLWSAFLNGIIFKRPGGKAEIINNAMGLPFNACNVVYEDRNGTIWIGSDGMGLFRFAGSQMIYFNKGHGMQSELITSSLEYDSKTLVFGSYDNGLLVYRDKKFENLPLKKAIIWATVEDKQKNLWIGTEDGLFKTNLKQTQEFNEESGSPGAKVTCFYKLSNDKILAGGAGGISVIENGKVQLLESNFDHVPTGTIRHIVKYKGKIICAADGGLFEFKDGRYSRYLNHRLSSYSLKVDSENALWIGTEDGLFRTEGKYLKKVFLSDQPASNFINFIVYHDQKIFAGTNNGLYVLRNLKQKEKAQVMHFGIEEGVVNLETNINSGMIDSYGRLWFGTASGLVRFDTETIDEMKLVKPFLNVLGVKLNFQTFDYGDYSNKLNLEGLPVELVLPHTKNNLIVELDGVQLKNYPDLKYEYWLEGFDTSWTPTFNSPLVNITNLPSGTYTLHVRAKNAIRSLSQEFKMDIRIKPVFYKTWWFILLCIIAFLALLYSYFQFRINRERAKRYQESLEFKTKLLALEQQSLNASMNRHFIFNSLNSIQYFINTQDKYSANKYLTNFAKLIRKNLDASTENNNQVTLQQEIERLELYLSLESMRFKDRFDYRIDTGDIDLESVEVPAMLFQPFVENSIMHGILPNTDVKGLITIKLSIENNKIVVCIEDNGIGIENSMAKKGLLEGDHKSQGMQITARRINLLNKLSREDYELDGPFQINDENRLINGTRVLIKIPYKNLAD
ncbi:MAG: two-component regulator propeller domain-containing protein [Bacteroidota bacterium]